MSARTTGPEDRNTTDQPRLRTEAGNAPRIPPAVDATSSVTPAGEKESTGEAVPGQVRATEVVLQEQVDLQTAILNALPSHIALVDAHGVITAINEAWCLFAIGNQLPDPSFGIGQNYLTLCERAALGDETSGCWTIAEGLRRVLEGHLKQFCHEYPCHAPHEWRWFLMTITPLSTDRQAGAVIAHTDITERKRAELALRESEERFRATFEQTAVGVAHSDADGTVVRVNERLCAMLGFGAEEMLRRPLIDFGFPEHRVASEEARRAMLAGNRTSYATEQRYRHKNNGTVWVNLVTTVIRNHVDAPDFITIIEDITLRKSADMRVQGINRLYVVLSKVGASIRSRTPRQLYDQACQILVDDGKLRMALVVEPEPGNGGIRLITAAGPVDSAMTCLLTSKDNGGLYAHGTSGTAFKTGRHAICNDIARDPSMAAWRMVAANNGLHSAASFPLAVDGVVTAVLMLFAEQPDYFHDDEIALMVSVSDNMSFALDSMLQERERVAVQEALRDSERRFRALSEYSADGVSLFDADHRVLYQSPGVAAIEGRIPDEIRTHLNWENTHPDDTPVILEMLQRVKATPGKPFPCIWRQRHADGRWLWLEGTTTNLLDDPAVHAIVTNYRDVTDRKSAETEIRQSQALLRMASRVGRIGAWALDLTTFAVTWSDEIKAIHEVPSDFVPTLEHALDFYPVEYRSQVTSTITACRNDGRPFDMELEIITAKGRRLWVRTIGEAVRDVHGVITGLQGACQDISDRKLAAEEYRQIAARLTTTLESITEAFYTVDRDWRLTYMNHRAELIFRRPRSELLGKGLWDEFPEARDTMFHRHFQEAMRDNTSVHFQDYYAPFDAWFEVHVYASEQGLAVYVNDVSEQQRAREALRVSEERFRLLSKASNDAIWDWDVVNQTVWWNEGFDTLFGYKRDAQSTTLESWTTCIHPEDRRRVMDSIEHAIETGAELWREEYRFRCADGHYAYVGDRGHLIRNEEGRTIRMIGGMIDLTARKKADERIAEQAALLDEARDAISVRDLQHRITYLNRSAERMYGWSAVEAKGQSVRQLVYQSVEAAYDKAMQAVLEHGEWTGELSPISKDGRRLLIETRWTLVRDDKGQPRSVLAICTDITERRKLEQQFLRAQRMESIGTLAGGIAHDLNNVLTPILLSIELLMNGETDKRRLRTLSIIGTSAKRGADMVKQVLSFARGVESQRLPVDITKVIREIEKIINETFLKNIQVRAVIDHDLHAVCGDMTQIHQVLLNLCVNARDAMTDGGALTLSAENVVLDELYAKLHPDAKPGTYVAICVEDTGSGMPPEIMEKIFEPFFTTKEVGKGTGLGLSTSLAVAKSHGGFLRVYSELGKGTAFTLYLPALATSETGKQSDTHLALAKGNGELILVVDDEESVRQITRQVLESFGFRVLLAVDGSDALARFSAHRHEISLVLTDMMMPVMDGAATIRVLMKMHPDLRIIAASGLHDSQVISKAMSGGVRHFLTKPYTAEALLKKVCEVLAPVR